MDAEDLMCECEPGNGRDRYSVAVIKHNVIISHLPRKISQVCSFFLQRGGSIKMPSYWIKKILSRLATGQCRSAMYIIV